MRLPFNLLFLDLCLLDKRKKDIPTTVLTCARQKDKNLVRTPCPFLLFFEMPGKEAFLSNLEPLRFDNLETKTIV